MIRSRPSRLVSAVLAAAVLVVLGARPVGAHVDLEPEEAVAGSTTVLTFSFHHGLDGSDTTGLVVQLTPGAELVSVPEKEGWTVEVEETDPPVVHWSGGRVPDGVEETFEVTVRLPEEPGVARFPTVQETDAGELPWIAEEGGDTEADNPAPRLTLVADPDRPTPTETVDPEEADPAPGATDPPVVTEPEGTDPEGTAVDVVRGGGDDGLPGWVLPLGVVVVAAAVVAAVVLRRRS